MSSLCGSHALGRSVDLPEERQQHPPLVAVSAFAFLAVGLSSQQEHSERLFPGRPGHGLVAGEFTHLLAAPLSTGRLHQNLHP